MESIGNHYNCIYKLTSPSGKVYIGQTRDFNRRLNEHILPSSGCTKIKNAIQKYGIDSFTIEILKEDINPSDLNKWEIYYIDQFDSFNSGYNLTKGGEGLLKQDGHGITYGTGKYGITTDDPRYRKIPEIKEKRKEYRQRPDIKEKLKEYYQKPDVKEKKKESDKKYRQRPDVKEKRKEYNQRPDIKEKRKEYNQRPEIKEKKKEYNQRPEIKEKKKEYMKEYNKNYKEKQKAIKKALKQNNGQMPLSAYL